MSTTVKQSAVDSLGLLSQILPMTSVEATQEVAVALNSRISQHGEDIQANADVIAQLQQQVADLPQLGQEEQTAVLQLIQDNLPEMDLNYRVNYLGDQIDSQVFLQMLADQQAAKAIGVEEVQRTNGYVSSAKVVFADATDQTVTFVRTEANGVATYTGRIANGAGGLVDGYEMKFSISQFTVEGLALTKTWDQDLVAHKLFVTGLSVEFDAVQPESDGDAPATL